MGRGNGQREKREGAKEREPKRKDERERRDEKVSEREKMHRPRVIRRHSYLEFLR